MHDEESACPAESGSPMGSIILLLNAAQWVVLEALTAAAWTRSSYS